MASLSTERTFIRVPQSEASWNTAAKDLHVSRSWINAAERLQSGSQVTQAQHLVAKVYWPKLLSKAKINLQAMGIDNEFIAACAWLRAYEPFQAYLASVRAGADITPYDLDDEHDLGPFEVPRAHQLETMRLERSRISDEDTVNAGLLSLLTCLTIKHPSPLGQWMTRRIGLNAQFAKGSYTARVDGYLKGRSDEGVKCLVEVKATKRSQAEPNVSMQETAEIVAWIKTTGLQSANQRPVFLAQDGVEIFILTITFNAAYRRYIDDATVKSLPAKRLSHGPEIWALVH